MNALFTSKRTQAPILFSNRKALLSIALLLNRVPCLRPSILTGAYESF